MSSAPVPSNKAAAHGAPRSCRRAARSNAARLIAARGASRAASAAGRTPASSVAPTPSTPAFTKGSSATPSGATRARKYRSLMVVSTSAVNPWASSQPSSRPKAVETIPSNRLSASTSQAMSQRVTPRARRVPKPSRRCTTAKLMVA